MNRDQKAAAIAEIATQIQESEAVYAVDYRGISVTQAAELRTKLRDADASFRIVKNTLTERAADEAGAEGLKTMLAGPTALTFVRGDAAVAAKALRDYARTTSDLLAFKGGMLGKDTLDADQIRSIAQLPSRDVLYAQLVGVTASPITGLVRSLGALIGGLAIALGGVRDQRVASGEAVEAPEPPAAEAPAEEAPAEEAPAAEATTEPEATAEEPAVPDTTETETQED